MLFYYFPYSNKQCTFPRNASKNREMLVKSQTAAHFLFHCTDLNTVISHSLLPPLVGLHMTQQYVVCDTFSGNV